jgi:hypothetical protein
MDRLGAARRNPERAPRLIRRHLAARRGLAARF